MSSIQARHQAELAARNYLELRGYKILEQNWCRPRAEIDVIATKAGVIYFVEVKYHADYNQGGGLEAITSSKLKMLRYAAALWVEENEWAGAFQLAAVEIAGREYTVMSFIDNVL